MWWKFVPKKWTLYICCFFFVWMSCVICSCVISYNLDFWEGATIYLVNHIFSSVQFSCSAVSNSLRPHELQHARPPCPSSRSSLKLMSIELVMPSSHLILCHPLLLLPPVPPSIRVWCIVGDKYLLSGWMEWMDDIVMGNFKCFYLNIYNYVHFLWVVILRS